MGIGIGVNVWLLRMRGAVPPLRHEGLIADGEKLKGCVRNDGLVKVCPGASWPISTDGRAGPVWGALSGAVYCGYCGASCVGCVTYIG